MAVCREVRYTVKSDKLLVSLHKELEAVEKQEYKLYNAAIKAKPASWKELIEKRIPEKVYLGLKSAYCKAFALVFDQGRSLIEKSYNKEELAADHVIRDFAVEVKGSRRELRKLGKNARKTENLNVAITTLEGIGLGALGIGIPDIVLFISTLLKGVYETAVGYGFDYAGREEQMLILKLLKVSLSYGDDWAEGNMQVEKLMRSKLVHEVSDEEFQRQLNETASAFALDMLILKFVQGIPVVGLMAGAANPVYYKKIMRYVHLKYKKHYILRKMSEREAFIETDGKRLQA